MVLGGINVGKEILDALVNKEKINWSKVFLKFGEGCLEGLNIKSTIGKTALDVVISPLCEFAEAKIDGKDYNLFQGMNRKIFRNVAGKYTKYMNKNIRKPIEEAFKGSYFDNKGIKNIAEKLHKFGNSKIGQVTKEYLKNLREGIQEEKDYMDLYAIAKMTNEAATDNLLGNSNIENDLFGNAILKANKKTINDFIQKNYNQNKRTSSKEDINNGLVDLSGS